MLQIIHRDVVLTQQQADAINPILVAHMNGMYRGKKNLHKAIDEALSAAGCPVVSPIANSPDHAARSTQP